MQAPYIEATYGNSELVQGFCRSCCVKGGLTALRHTVDSLSIHYDRITAVHTSEGATIRCGALAATASWMHPFLREQLLHTQLPDNLTAMTAGIVEPCSDSGDNLPRDPPDLSCEHEAPVNSSSTRQDDAVGGGRVSQRRTIARAICLANGPIILAAHNSQLVFPPGACGNPNTVFVWQCDPALHVCPAGRVLVHLATQGGERTAREDLQCCLEALVQTPEQRAKEDSTDSCPTRGLQGTDVPSTTSPSTMISSEHSQATATVGPCLEDEKAAQTIQPAAEPPLSADKPSPKLSNSRPQACVACYFNQVRVFLMR